MSRTMLEKWNKWAAGVQINDRKMTPDNNEYGVAMAAFYAGYDSHAIESAAAQAVSLPDREAIAELIGQAREYERRGAEGVPVAEGEDVFALIASMADALSSVPLTINREELAKVIQRGSAEAFFNGARGAAALAQGSADAVLAALSTQPAAVDCEGTCDYYGGVCVTCGRAQPTELAELFPGTLAALDRLSIRPEVQS